jgi:hypothetical protein
MAVPQLRYVITVAKIPAGLPVSLARKARGRVWRQVTGEEAQRLLAAGEATFQRNAVTIPVQKK